MRPRPFIDGRVVAIGVAVALAGSVAAAQTVSALAAADEAMRQGRMAEAARQYEGWLTRHPDTPEVLFALGVCRIELGQPSAAVPPLRRYVALLPERASGHAALGVALLDVNARDEARQALDAALARDPRHLQAVEARARLDLIEGQPAQAIVLLSSLDPASIASDRRGELQRLLAESMLAAGQPAGAAALLESAIGAEGAVSPATYALACLARVRAGDLEQAAVTCEAGMRRYPDSEIEGAYLTLPPAVLARRTAARLSALGERPDPAELVALGRVLTDVDPRRQTRAEALARQLLSDAVALAPSSPSAHYNLGRVLRRTDTAAALASWEKALTLDPAPSLRVQIETQVARARDAQGDTAGADRFFRAALETNRQLEARVPEAALEYARFLAVNGRTDEAASVVDEVIAWNPWTPEARLERARLLADHGRWQESIVEASFVLAHARDRKTLLAPAHLLLSRAYHRLGQPEKARAHREWLESQ